MAPPRRFRSWWSSFWVAIFNAFAKTFPQSALVVTGGWHLFLYDFQYRYGVSFLGYLWPVVKPVLNLIPLIFIGRALDLQSQHQAAVPYELYVISGYLVWNLFWDSVIHTLLMTRRVRKVLLRVDIPLSVLICGGLFHTGMTGIINFIGLVVVLAYFHVGIGAAFFLAPFPCAIAVLLGLSIGVPIAGVSYLYQDASHGIGYLNQILFWLTPVVAVLPVSGKIGMLFDVNPLTYVISAFRAAVFGQDLEAIYEPRFLIAAFATLVCLRFAFFIYKRTARLAVEFVL